MKSHSSFRGLVFSTIVALLCVAGQANAQRGIILYTDPSFDAYGFTSKLTASLQKSSIASRFKAAFTPTLEALNASKTGDYVAQIIASEFVCEGKKMYALSLVFFEMGRDKSNVIQKVYIGSAAGYIQEQTVDVDVEQYSKIIVDALGAR